MAEIKYSIMENTEEYAITAEKMRYRAYGVEKNLNITDFYYVDEIKNGTILVFLCKLDEKIAATCYVSNFLNSLYIEYVFVQPEYQKTGLYLGRKLLQYIFDNKHLVEDYFDCIFTKSKLIPSNNNTQKMYKKLGYQNESDLEIMSKSI